MLELVPVVAMGYPEMANFDRDNPKGIGPRTGSRDFPQLRFAVLREK
jgi:hypothetical protein